MAKYVDYDNLDRFYDNIADRPVQAFDTVADMQAATYLEAGMTCHTNGFRTSGDGGAAYYIIGTTGIANGMDMLALQGGMVATLAKEAELNVKQFGAYGNGVNDDYSKIQAALTSLNNTGGTLFIPAGIYNVSKSLTVGSNTTVLGVGPKSYINLTSDTDIGTAIAVCGSNVIIDSISGGYVDDDRPFVSTSGNMGFIGIGTYTFDSAKAFNEGEIPVGNLISTDYHNVTVRNFYCESTYPLQTEPSSGGNIDEVTYDNICCPYGTVSISANHDGAVSNANISNVVCAFLRLASGWDENHFNVSNVYCNILRASNRHNNINNVTVRYDSGSVVRDWFDSGQFDYSELFYAQESNIANVIIDACDTAIRGMQIVSNVSNTSRYSRLNNVVVKNVNNPNGDAVYIAGSDTYRNTICTGCDFSNNISNGNVLCGVFIGCKLGDVDTARSFIYADNHTRSVGFTYGSGMASLSAFADLNTFSRYHYDTAKIYGGAYPTDSTYFTQDSSKVIGTVSARYAPKERQALQCDVYNADFTKHSPALCYIETTGEITLSHILIFSTNVFNRLVINDAYIVGV